MKYLVTGAAGFIGSHICDRLVEEGHQVVALDNLSTGNRQNLAHLLDEIEFVEGDVCDEERCKALCQGVDHVIHQAALGSVPRSVDDPLRTHENNATGTLNLLVAARDAEVSSFVFAASSSVYGDTEVLPKHEEMTPRPQSPYATSKLTCELYARNFAALYGLPTVCLRYFNIFGPRQDPSGAYAAVVPCFVDALLDGQQATIFGDGEQSRDFTYVSNAVDANLRATERASDIAGAVINIGCGDRTTINDLYRFIAQACDVDRPARHVEPRAGDVRHSLASLERARELLGYRPVVSVEEGLQRTVAWFAEQRGQ